MFNIATVESTSEVLIDRAVILERFDGDLQLLHEVAGLFIEDCPRRLADLREAMAQRDCEALERAAHSIKGSVSNFAAAAAVGAALRVEQLARAGDLLHLADACAVLEAEITRLTPVLAALH